MHHADLCKRRGDINTECLALTEGNALAFVEYIKPTCKFMIVQRFPPAHVYIGEDNFRHFPIYILGRGENLFLFSFVYFPRAWKLLPQNSFPSDTGWIKFGFAIARRIFMLLVSDFVLNGNLSGRSICRFNLPSSKALSTFPSCLIFIAMTLHTITHGLRQVVESDTNSASFAMKIFPWPGG